MGAATASQNKIVLQIACENLGSSSQPSAFETNDEGIAALLGRLLSDPNTEKVISLSGYRARHGETTRAPAPDFNGAMRLVEQECYSQN